MIRRVVRVVWMKETGAPVATTEVGSSAICRKTIVVGPALIVLARANTSLPVLISMSFLSESLRWLDIIAVKEVKSQKHTQSLLLSLMTISSSSMSRRAKPPSKSAPSCRPTPLPKAYLLTTIRPVGRETKGFCSSALIWSMSYSNLIECSRDIQGYACGENFPSSRCGENTRLARLTFSASSRMQVNFV